MENCPKMIMQFRLSVPTQLRRRGEATCRRSRGWPSIDRPLCRHRRNRGHGSYPTSASLTPPRNSEEGRTEPTEIGRCQGYTGRGELILAWIRFIFFCIVEFHIWVELRD